MSYRMRAIEDIQFEENLRGKGAQVGNDMLFSLSVKRSGWRLIYDPAVAVDHFPAVRFDSDQRSGFEKQACEDAAFNKHWALLTALPAGAVRVKALLWQGLVGTHGNPGLLHFVKALFAGDAHAFTLWRSAMRGRRAARLALKAKTDRT
jgi:hypothetical protein